MADLSGRLNIELRRGQQGVEATVSSSRPTAAARVFADKTVSETALSLPSLFSICSTAQACACASACEAALGLSPSSSIIRLRCLLVDAETIKEHLWRILLDWPRFLDEPSQKDGMSKAMGTFLRLRSQLTRPTNPMRPGVDSLEPDIRALADTLKAQSGLIQKLVLGIHPTDWLARMQSREGLLAWAEGTDTAAARLLHQVEARGWASLGGNPVTALPRLEAADLEPFLTDADADRFVAEPRWQSEPRESSPFTRQQFRTPVVALTRDLGNGLLPRLAAQLLELALLQERLRTASVSLDEPAEPLAAATGKGVGIALVPAARGLLVHRAEITGNRIRHYRILAPTEWNFHPQGVVARGLAALPATDEETLKRQAALFVTAVDPCVDYHVTIS